MYKKRKGFTLFEVIVTISLIAILSSIILPKYIVYREKVEVNKAIFTGKEINKVAIMSYIQQGSIFVKSQIISLMQRTTEINLTEGDIIVNASDASMVTINFHSQDKAYSIIIQTNVEYKIYTSGGMIFRENEST